LTNVKQIFAIAPIILVLFASTSANGNFNPGVCLLCHHSEPIAFATPSGHSAKLDCLSCHFQRRPNRVGRGHFATAGCPLCHEQMVGHPEAAVKRTRHDPTRNCLGCHDPHGTSNLHLIRPAIRTHGLLKSVDFVSEAGAAPGSFANPADPGTGLCETCHLKTDFYRANGKGHPHFTQSCIDCHDHGVAFAPVATPQNCSICHADETARLAKPSLHQEMFQCTSCHATVLQTPGPGHQSAKTCQDCHSNATHAPPGYAALPCTQCHDPHGTDNTQLVLDAITTTQGPMRPIVFNNLLGRADGSFASASAPGTGICEVCHTTTRFYRADGSGQPHFTFSCLPCHLHAEGFNPQ
jgi:predicted CXXCH cytochrome family protein